MATEVEKYAAFQTFFNKVISALHELEVARGHDLAAFNAREDGLLAENVTIIANQAREGLRVITLGPFAPQRSTSEA